MTGAMLLKVLGVQKAHRARRKPSRDKTPQILSNFQLGPIFQVLCSSFRVSIEINPIIPGLGRHSK